MKPITRIERYLAYITRDEDSTEIDDPIIRVEMYLAKIAGIEVEIPERPITRVEMYLAKIAGEDVDIPDRPITRIEMYLAAIAGEEREVPDPITRVEQYLYAWVNLGPAWEIVTITGVSPLALQKALQQPIRSLTQFGKCVQDGADIMCNNGALKYGATGKNLIDIPASVTKDGITFTKDSDGYVTASPSNADPRSWGKNNAQFLVNLAPGNYKFVIKLKTPSASQYSGWEIYSPTGVKIAGSSGGKFQADEVAAFTASESGNYYIMAKLHSSASRLMVVKDGADTSNYEPYTEGIYTDGAPEVLTITATGAEDQTATVENLFAVDDIVDEQDIITGKVIRRTEAVVSDGTTPSGRYVGEVGVGNIIIKARETGYSGEIVSFTTEDETPLNGIRVNFEPVQDLHGYDSPWPAGGGKNLLWLNNGIFKTGAFGNTTPRETTGVGTWVGMSSSNYLAPNNITSYTIGDNSLTVTATANGYGVGFECKVTAGQKYTLSWVGTNAYVGIAFYADNGEYLSYVTSGVSPKTFTVPESTANAIIVLRGDGANVTGEFSNVQLEEGQTATAYSPYANICPISGWSEVTVEQSGKNLFDPSSLSHTTYTVNSDESITVNSSDGRAWSSIPEYSLKAGTYTISATGFANNSQCQFRTSEDSYDTTQYLRNTVENRTFTLTSDGGIKLKVGTGTSNYPVVFKVQIELGSTATAYEPYSGSTYSITFPSEAGTVYSGTLDVTTGKLTVTHGNIASYSGETLPGRWISSMDVYSVGGTPTTGAQVVYELATPQTYQLTPMQIELFTGENNIWSNGKSVNVYVPSGDVVEQVTPQKLKTAQGTNTVSVVSNVDPVALEVEYTAEAS